MTVQEWDPRGRRVEFELTRMSRALSGDRYTRLVDDIFRSEPGAQPSAQIAPTPTVTATSSC